MLYKIHRYPSELIDVVELEDGQRVLIRPVLPQDEEITSVFFGGLSASARYNRFMNPMRNMPAELLRRLTQVDYSEHLALVAEVFVGGRETVIAEARYVRSNDASAEFAIAVAEPWRERGLASLMLAKLTHRAAAAGVRRLCGETLASNDKMLRLARKAGFAIRSSPDVRGVMLLEKILDATSLNPSVDRPPNERLAA